MASNTVDPKFFENRYIGSLIEHSKEKLSELQELAEKEPRYKRASIEALQALSRSLEQGNLAELSFHGCDLDGSTRRHVEELKRCYLGTSEEAPLPKQVLRLQELNGFLVYSDIPPGEVATMKSLLLENAKEQVKEALETLSQKRPAEEDPRSMRASKRTKEQEKRAERARFLAQAEQTRLNQARIRIEEALNRVQNNGEELETLPPDLHANEEIVRAAFRNSPLSIRFASPALVTNAEFLLSLITTHLEYGHVHTLTSFIVNFIPDLINNTDFLLRAITKTPHIDAIFAHIPAAMKANATFILDVIRRVSPDDLTRILHYANASLKSNPAFILDLVQLNPNECHAILHHANASLQSNAVFITSLFQSLSNHPYTILNYAAAGLKSNPGFVLDLVQLNPNALRIILHYTDASLKSNPAFVLGLAKLCPNECDVVLYHVDASLKSNPAFILDLAKLYPNDLGVVLHYTDASLKSNPAFVLDLAKLYPNNVVVIMNRIDPSLKSNPAFLLQLATIYSPGEVFYYASDELCNDKAFLLDMAKIALNKGNSLYSSFLFLQSSRLCSDQEFIEDLCALDSGSGEFITHICSNHLTQELKENVDFIIRLMERLPQHAGIIYDNSHCRVNTQVLRTYARLKIQNTCTIM